MLSLAIPSCSAKLFHSHSCSPPDPPVLLRTGIWELSRGDKCDTNQGEAGAGTGDAPEILGGIDYLIRTALLSCKAASKHINPIQVN